jgi:PKHD-type hydroxylase|tara:strand:+ start:321 stop:551 length:231 start_codon:yes stop_codon:yes gene_type:complete
MIRKLSFTLCLNDEFEGGDFNICETHPISEKTKVKSFTLKKGQMIIFPSHTWHKVNKITKGIRKSLVGWVVGRPFI